MSGFRKSRYDAIRLHPAKAVEDFSAYKGVWVIVEQRQGEIQDVTKELLGAARPMAEKLGVPVTAVLLTHDAADLPKTLIAAGADKVIVAENPILRTPLARPSTEVLTRLIKERRPEVVLIGATHTGRDISSRVAVKVDAGMTADCTELDVDDTSGELLARRPAFGGKMLATIRCDRHRPQMATARPGIFVPLEPDTSRKGDVEKVDVSWLDAIEFAARVVDYVVDEGVDITKEDVLVAGGLGVGPDGWDRLRALAHALGGELACSRPVADNGWVERSRQVGQTGVSVRPKLYIAVGISGAIQHIEGMKESGTVIAINKDPNAPIFQYADIGIVADWKGVVDALTKEAEKRGLADMKWMVPMKDTLEADRQAAAERAGKAGKAPAAKTGKASAAKAGKEEVPKTDSSGKEEAPKTDPSGKEGAEGTSSSAKEGKQGAEAPEAGQQAAAEAPVVEARPADATPGDDAAGAEATYPGDPTDAAAVKAWVKDHVKEEDKAWVLAADCIVCNGCEAACPTGAAVVTDIARVDRDLCIADGACFDACPTDAIRPGIEDETTSSGWPEGSRRAGEFGV